MAQGMRRAVLSIGRPNSTSVSSTGELAGAYTSIATNVAATMWAIRGNAPSRDYGRAANATHFAMLPRGTDVKVADQLSDGTRKFVVLFVEDFGHHIEIDAELQPV